MKSSAKDQFVNFVKYANTADPNIQCMVYRAAIKHDARTKLDEADNREAAATYGPIAEEHFKQSVKDQELSPDERIDIFKKFFELGPKFASAATIRQMVTEDMRVGYGPSEIGLFVHCAEAAAPHIKLAAYQAAAQHKKVGFAERMDFYEKSLTLTSELNTPAKETLAFFKEMMVSCKPKEIETVAQHVGTADSTARLVAYEAAAQRKDIKPLQCYDLAEKYFAIAPTIDPPIPSSDQQTFATKVQLALAEQMRSAKTSEQKSLIKGFTHALQNRVTALMPPDGDEPGSSSHVGPKLEAESDEKQVPSVAATNKNPLHRMEEPPDIEPPKKRARTKAPPPYEGNKNEVGQRRSERLNVLSTPLNPQPSPVGAQPNSSTDTQNILKTAGNIKAPPDQGSQQQGR